MDEKSEKGSVEGPWACVRVRTACALLPPDACSRGGRGPTGFSRVPVVVFVQCVEWGTYKWWNGVWVGAQHRDGAVWTFVDIQAQRGVYVRFPLFPELLSVALLVPRERLRA